MDKVVIITLYILMVLSGLGAIGDKNISSCIAFGVSACLLVAILRFMGVF